MRFKVGDNYEECYLKVNSLKKSLKHGDNIQDEDFKRVVKYITRKTYNINRRKLVRHGFEIEDMESIITLYGMMFLDTKAANKPKKDKHYLMMRFINQKLESFYVFMDKKFKIKENVTEKEFNEDAFNVPNSEFYCSEEDVDYTQEKLSVKEKTILKKELEENIELYKDELQRIATSKFVDYNLRKAARRMCKKNNIDYIKWAKDLITKNNLNSNDFILEN